MTDTATPVIFIHGLWLHSDSWKPWMTLFEQAGYAPVAPGWPGDKSTVDETRRDTSGIGGVSIQQVANHYISIARSFPVKPIVVGHSFGGLIAQKLLEAGVVSAAVAIDPSAIKGVNKVPFAQIRAVLPVISKKSNRPKAFALNEKQFRFGFGNKLSKAESNALWQKWSIPSAALPVFETAGAKKDPASGTTVNTTKTNRGPLLITAGEFDHTVPAVIDRLTFDEYRTSTAVTDFHQFPDRGHSLTIDHGWEEVAKYTLAWLRTQKVAPDAAANDNSASTL